MLVVIAVRNAHAHFMELACPVQLLQMALLLALGHIGSIRCDHGLQQALSRAGDPVRLLRIGAKTLGQPADHGRADILGRFAVNQVVKCAMAQGPLSGMHFIDLQQIEHRLQNRQTATYDRFALFLDTVQTKVVGLVGLEQTLFEPIQTITRHASLGPASLSQDVRHRTHGA